MKEKDIDSVVSDYIGRICKPIFEKAAKEIPKNLMLVASQSKNNTSISYYQPHNIRRVFDFKHPEFLSSNHLKNQPTHRLVNSGKEIQIDNYKECSIRIRRNTIQITNFIDHKRWYSIDNYNAQQVIKEITEKKEKETVEVLKSYLNEYGGTSTFKLISFYTEPKIKGNPITERLSEPLRWHTDNHKKVYAEKVIELYDINKAIALIDNSIFYSNNKEIADPLIEMAGYLKQLGTGKDIVETNSIMNYHKPFFHATISPESLISNISCPQDFDKFKEEYSTLSWDDKLKVCEHIKTLLEKEADDIEKLL